MRAPIGGTAPIAGAARSARYGRGRTSEESHFMGRLTNGPSDGSQAMIPKLGTSHQLTTQADGNQRVNSGGEQLNYRSDGSWSPSPRREQNGDFYASFPRY